jgi:hypothetical protein
VAATRAPIAQFWTRLRTDALRQPESGEVGVEEGDDFCRASVEQGEDVETAGMYAAAASSHR